MLWAFPESRQDIRLPDTEQTGLCRVPGTEGWSSGLSLHPSSHGEGDDQGRRERERAKYGSPHLGGGSGMCVELVKRMPAPGWASPSLGVQRGQQAGTQARPDGLTLFERQHQIRPAPRQGWQAISRTGGAGGRTDTQRCGVGGRRRGKNVVIQTHTDTQNDRTELHGQDSGVCVCSHGAQQCPGGPPAPGPAGHS